jgi:predicted O-methyltransferase YrrM
MRGCELRFLAGPPVFIVFAGILVFLSVLRADLRRRRLSVQRRAGWRVLSGFDLAAPAACLGIAAALLAGSVAISNGMVRLSSANAWGILSSTLIFTFLWSEGRRQIQFQRPRGIVFAEWLILGAANQVFASIVFGDYLLLHRGLASTVPSLLAAGAGATLIVTIVPPFVKKGSEYHRILRHLAEEGESVQKEYTPPSAECPNPQLWNMVDSQTTELEVLDFLKCLVTTLKPSLILETGTFLGYGTIKLAEGVRANGFGKVITIEYDPAILAKARERIEAAGLAPWVESRNESSLDSRIEGTIDFYFSDSALAIREQEIRRLLPQVDPRGLIAIHDASSHFKVVREAALRLEQEGLLSIVLLSTPRGLVLAQRREGRK